MTFLLLYLLLMNNELVNLLSSPLSCSRLPWYSVHLFSLKKNKYILISFLLCCSVWSPFSDATSVPIAWRSADTAEIVSHLITENAETGILFVFFYVCYLLSTKTFFSTNWNSYVNFVFYRPPCALVLKAKCCSWFDILQHTTSDPNIARYVLFSLQYIHEIRIYSHVSVQWW